MFKPGDKIMVSHRKLFPNDQQRYFTGLVDAYEHGLVKATGHSWAREPNMGEVVRKEGMRTKIFSLTAGTVMAYHLPDSVDMSHLRFEALAWEVIVTDGNYRMDLAEYVHGGELHA